MSVKKLGIAAAAVLIAAGSAGASSAADVLDQVPPMVIAGRVFAGPGSPVLERLDQLLPLDIAGLGGVQSGVGLPDDTAELPDGETMFEETNSRLAAGRERLMDGLAKASEGVAAEGGNDKAEAMIAVMPIVYDAIGPATVGALQQGTGGLTQGMGHGVGAAMGALSGALNLNPGQGAGGSF
ncbi:MAG: hypothetical protein AB7P52_10830 [Alphaproteobacteria bacterium]